MSTEPGTRSSGVVADTHAVIWYVTAPAMLSETAARILEEAVTADRPVLVSAVSLIELVYVAEKRSDSIDGDTLRELFALIARPGSPFDVAPLTVEVARAMTAINRAQVRDPFDRAIVATAQVARARLVTRDGVLTRHFPDLCVW